MLTCRGWCARPYTVYTGYLVHVADDKCERGGKDELVGAGQGVPSLEEGVEGLWGALAALGVQEPCVGNQRECSAAPLAVGRHVWLHDGVDGACGAGADGHLPLIVAHRRGIELLLRLLAGSNEGSVVCL